MSAATIWKGVIQFGDVKVPVRFLSAVQDRSAQFNLLHAPDHVRVKQVMVNSETGEAVPSNRIRRGFEVADDTYVVVDDSELKELRPRESRTIRVECFVPNEQINHQWYDRAYYLGPDGSSSDYAALLDALRHNRLEGVARWVMRKRPYVGSLQSADGHLAMVTLRHADEVIPVSSLPRPEGRKLEQKELDLAAQLVAAFHTEFDPGKYHDEYRQRLLDFIQAKARGRKPRLRLVRPPKVTDPNTLAAVLSASLKSVRKERLIA